MSIHADEQQEPKTLPEAHPDSILALQGPLPVYPVVINFPYNGQDRSESLLFSHPIDIPPRGESMTLKFNDFGTMRRIAGSVEHTSREFYGAGAVEGVKAGYIVQITLIGITNQ